MSQLEKVGLLVYTAIKSGMLSPGKEYDFDFTMSSWNQKLGRQSLPTKALWDTDLGVQSWQIPKLEQKRYQESRIVFYLHSYKTYCLRILGELRCCSLKMHSFSKFEFVVSSMFPKTKKAVKLFLLNCLIFSVDQLGLEPRTSRLWVCCSNQLSYKSIEFLSNSSAKILDFRQITK